MVTSAAYLTRTAGGSQQGPRGLAPLASDPWPRGFAPAHLGSRSHAAFAPYHRGGRMRPASLAVAGRETAGRGWRA